MKPTPALVWDLPIRLFHWLLVGLLGFSWWSGEQHEMDWHRFSGYAICALLVFRFYWGVVGGRTARFAQFVRGPRAVIAYLRAGGKQAAAGHNPLGGWSVVLMLAALTVMVTAGLFAVDVDGLESGPLADYVGFDTGRLASDVHGVVFNLLLALVALHVLAIAFYLLVLRKPLLRPMITGRSVAGSKAEDTPLGAPVWRALLGIIIAGAVTYAFATGFRF